MGVVLSERDEPRPECHLTPRWTFVLGSQDALLVLRALGGRITDEEDLVAAQQLGDRLTLLREASAQGPLQALIRAADHVRAKQEEAS